MSPLTLLFSSTPGANSNKAQGADFNSNDGGGDEGIFLSFFPFLTNKIKAWHSCMTANLQTSFWISFFWPPSLFYPPWGASECTRLSSSFLYQPLSSLESCKPEDLTWGERALLNRKEIPVILISPVAADSDVIWIQFCMSFCLLWWIKFL